MLEDAEITEYQKQKEDACFNTVVTDKQKPRHEKRKTFWKEFIQYCKDNDGLFANNSPVGDNWIGKGIGAPFGINMCAVIGYDFARVEIYFNSGEKELNKKVFDYLYAKKDEIEAEYGGSLIWERHTDKVTCRVSDAIQFSCFDVEDRTEVFKFLKEASEKMKDAAGEPLQIAFWALGEREGQDGDDYQVLLINDVNDIVYSTSSATFIAQFLEALEVFGDLKAIEVQPKKSKRTGREYLALKVVE